jgi:hypothetical protein
VDARLPKLDLPELILEMNARTGFAAHFTHASESASRAEDISTGSVANCLCPGEDWLNASGAGYVRVQVASF